MKVRNIQKRTILPKALHFKSLVKNNSYYKNFFARTVDNIFTYSKWKYVHLSKAVNYHFDKNIIRTDIKLPKNNIFLNKNRRFTTNSYKTLVKYYPRTFKDKFVYNGYFLRTHNLRIKYTYWFRRYKKIWPTIIN